MKKFLKYILLFFLPFIATLIPLEFILRSVPNLYNYKYEWMQKNAEDVEILIFGSSHTNLGVNPKYIDGCAFNLAFPSQGWDIDVYLLNKWADRYKNLRLVVVPISYSSWFRGETEKRNYKLYMDYDMFPGFSLFDLEFSSFWTAKEKFVRWKNNDNSFVCDEYGFNAHKLEKKNKKRWENKSYATDVIKSHTANDWSNIEQNKGYLESMAEFCEKRNIKMILVTTPCWHDYYDNMNKKQYAKMKELTQEFLKKHHVLYFDHLKDSRFVADDFWDIDHLSDVGAEKFTKILNEEIRNSLLPKN